MHSQNCSFLPNKKQSAFNSTMPYNLGILKNFSSHSFSTFDPSTQSNSVNIKPTFKGLNPNKYSTKSAAIMDFVYSFGDTSRAKLRENLPSVTFQIEKSRQNNCKQILSHYNTFTQMPLLSSHLVGGFVGSKSQLGRRPTHGVGINMWDIIRELVDLVGKPKANVEKLNSQNNSFIGNKSPSVLKAKCREIHTNKNSNNMMNEPTKSKEKPIHSCCKQSYADVAKVKLNSLTKELPSAKVSCKMKGQEDIRSKGDCDYALESFSMCIKSDNRSRIVSECSIDSEDSFIVFEYCGGEEISSGDDCSTSDDEDISDFQIINEDSCTDDDSAPQKTVNSTSTRDQKSPRKKVQFAKGKDLTEVHPMVTWNYAYRAARRGPWEMLARDSERFRCRITNTEAILSPILDPAHREAVFQHRFAVSDSGT